jgi:flagellar biosynthesis component FlhA
MNPFALLSIGAAGLSLLLSVWLLVFGFNNSSQQKKWQEQQQELQNQQQKLSDLQQKAQQQQQQIQAGRQLAEQVGPAVLKDMVGFVHQNKNSILRDLLTRNGITVPDAPLPGSTPAPTP